jgi:hypothetical protein
MSYSFSDPASATGITWADHNGMLMLIEPTGTREGIVTANGPANAVEATVTILDGPAPGTVFADVLVFPRILCSQLRSRIGGMVLGRLSQGQARPGQSAPWTLTAANEAEKASAGAYLAQRPAQAPPATTPAASPWNATPAATAPAASPWTAAPAAGTVAAPPF